MAGQKISSCEANLLPGNEKCPNHDAVSASGTNGDSAGSMIPRSSVISTSLTSAEQTFESASTVYEQVSSKRCEISTQSSDRITLARPILVKSDISMENGLPLSNENYVMDVGKKQVSHLNAVEDGFNLIVHVKQKKTESSCSDSSSGILPVNHSQQETSKRASSFNNHSGSLSSSNSAGFHHRMEEPVTASTESGISAQIDCKAFLKGRARKAPLMIKDRISFHSMKANIPIYGPQNQENRNISRPDEENPHEWGSAVRKPRDGARYVDEETGIYRWVSGCTLSDEEKRDVTVGKTLICAGNSKNFNCSTEMEKHIRSSDANDNHITFSASTKISGESENLMSIKCESVKMDPKVTDNINDGFLLHESSEFLMTKPTTVFARDQSKSVILFDLNEDINTNELDDGEQSVVETVSSHNVIRVVAKAGVPSGRALIPLKFEGGLGWKGSAATSAFRPAFLLNSFDKNPFSRNLTGIDLNVAAVEDIPEIGFQTEDVWIPSASPFRDSRSEGGSRRAERLDIDLNCLCDDVVKSPQYYLPAESRNPRLADLDLNANTSAGYACNNVDWQGQGSQLLENKALFSVNSREHDVNFTSTYLPDLGAVNVFNHSHSHSQMMAAPNVLKQFEETYRVSPLQPKLPYPLHMLPLQNYPSHCPLYIAPMKPFMFNMHYPGTIPCVRDPQLLKPETVPASLGIPRLVEFAHGQSRGDITSSIHRIDVKSENNSSTSISKRDKAREFTLPVKNSSVDENDQSVNQEAWYAKLMKRKEPEGGWDCYHVGHRQVT